jgi:GH24 family phage-related lysozyme (muramidase)
VGKVGKVFKGFKADCVLKLAHVANMDDPAAVWTLGRGNTAYKSLLPLITLMTLTAMTAMKAMKAMKATKVHMYK